MVTRRTPRRAPKKAPGFSLSYMDRRADPQKDFYRFANGRWLKTHPLPPDKSRYASFTELGEWNLLALKKIAERCARDGSSSPGKTASLVGDFYRSGLDTESRESGAFRPVEDLWKAAERVGSPDDVAGALPGFHRVGFNALFTPFSKPDDRNSEVYAYFLWQGGLSLPDRDYYLDEAFADARRGFVAHVRRMLELKGVGKREAEKWSGSVLRIETAIAKASRTRTDLRDPVRNYNRTEAKELEERYAQLAPASYLRSSGVTADYAVVGQPEFLSSVSALLSKEDPDVWRAYLCWGVLRWGAPYLHRDAEDEDFDFYYRQLLGQKKPEPRWKRTIKIIDALVGEALGELYVKEHFPEEARKRAAELIENLSEVFVGRLKTLTWMTESTRAEALQKFSKFRVKIGHPARFRDYSSVEVDPRDYAGNVRRSVIFEFNRQAARVGKPVDRDEWYMTPPTVNAYYAAETNEIVFPAGILQPPFFDFRADDAVNYGGIGTVIGHEITHGYDDQGRQYDAKGNLRDWWTKEDETAFNRKTDGVARVYGEQEVLPGLKLNGRLTLGENIADLGGVSIAYEALMLQVRRGGGTRKLGGLTPQQRFFISWGQIWREVVTKQESRRLVSVDPHSPGMFRADIPAMNHPAFDEAFPRKKGGTRDRIGVW